MYHYSRSLSAIVVSDFLSLLPNSSSYEHLTQNTKKSGKTNWGHGPLFGLSMVNLGPSRPTKLDWTDPRRPCYVEKTRRRARRSRPSTIPLEGARGPPLRRRPLAAMRGLLSSSSALLRRAAGAAAQLSRRECGSASASAPSPLPRSPLQV